MITAQEGAGPISDAGYVPSACPWSGEAAKRVFSALFAAAGIPLP